MGLHASYWEYILKLLGIIVVIDRKIYQEEVEAFTTAALNLQKIISPEMILTKKMAFDWFVHHRERLKVIAESLDYDQEIIDIVSNLRGLPDRLEVMKAMVDIAISDDFYHDKEKLIIKKTIIYWNIDVPEAN